MANVFVYGTLLVDEVVRTLLKRVPARRDAVLHGFRRHRIHQQVFPAMVVGGNDDQVQGQVLFGLSDAEMQILDEYEDTDYERLTVHPELKDGSTTSAYTYVWHLSQAHLLHGVWDLEVFRSTHLKPYLSMSSAFAEEYAAASEGSTRVRGAGSRSS